MTLPTNINDREKDKFVEVDALPAVRVYVVAEDTVGDVTGPASSTDNAVARFDGTTGKIIQNSVVTIGDTGNVAGVGSLAVSGAVTGVTDLTMSGTLTGAANVYPTVATLWHMQSVATAGNAVTNFATESQLIGQWLQEPPANGDTFTNKFWMRAGTYTISWAGSTNTNRGIADWYIDDVAFQTSQDWYGALTYNVIKTSAITIATSGGHTLKCVVNGKNASSTNYYLVFSTMWIK